MSDEKSETKKSIEALESVLLDNEPIAIELGGIKLEFAEPGAGTCRKRLIEVYTIEDTFDAFNKATITIMTAASAAGVGVDDEVDLSESALVEHGLSEGKYLQLKAEKADACLAFIINTVKGAKEHKAAITDAAEDGEIFTTYFEIKGVLERPIMRGQLRRLEEALSAIEKADAEPSKPESEGMKAAI